VPVFDKKEQRQRVVLRRIFRSKREEVAGGWRKKHNEELTTVTPRHIS
jgi:hypothetical protein